MYTENFLPNHICVGTVDDTFALRTVLFLLTLHVFNAMVTLSPITVLDYKTAKDDSMTGRINHLQDYYVHE